MEVDTEGIPFKGYRSIGALGAAHTFISILMLSPAAGWVLSLLPNGTLGLNPFDERETMSIEL